jgi:glyoxylase-like metal-dependent hydrolase (beta-lactamase superfamily II)
MGDMHILVTYSDYKDFGGVKVPTKMIQTRGGEAFFDVTVSSAQANPANIAALIAGPAPAARGAGGPPAGGAPPLPAAGRGAGAPGAGAPPAGAQRGAAPAATAAPAAPAAPAALVSTSEKMADGVYRITGGAGTYVSLAVEFKDYIMLLEGGDTDARALAIITEAKRVIPNKPIRYVMNTHYHSDHSGGLATMVAEGATLVVHQNNKAFFEKAYSTPRTLLTDTLAKNPRKPKVEGVAEKKVFKDGNHSVEIYHTAPVPHTDGMLIAYLPKEKIIFQGDFSLPAAGQPANDHIKALMPILDRLKLDYTTYIPVHANTPDTVWTKADVMKAVGRTN